MFIPIKSQTLILKKMARNVFLMKPMYQYHSTNEENVLMVPNHENKGDYYVNPFLSQLKDVLQFKKWQ